MEDMETFVDDRGRTRFRLIEPQINLDRPLDEVPEWEPCCEEDHRNQAGGHCCPHYGNTCGTCPEND